MAKRFTDTTKWDKIWFRKLPPIVKCFWFYLLDRCNHAGIWEVDFEFAANYIGAELDQPMIEKALGERVVKLRDGAKWLIPGFLVFQYGTLNPLNKVHKSVIAILKSEGAFEGLPRGLLAPTVAPKDKAKDKAIAKAKGKDKETKVLTPAAKRLLKGRKGK